MAQPAPRGIRTFEMMQREATRPQDGGPGQRPPPGHPFPQMSVQQHIANQQQTVDGSVKGPQNQALGSGGLQPATPIKHGPTPTQPPNTRPNPLMMTSKFLSPQPSGNLQQSQVSFNQSVASRPGQAQPNPNQSLNDYFNEFQRRNAQANPRFHPTVATSQFISQAPGNSSMSIRNPLKVNVSHQLLLEKSLLSDQQSFNHVVPGADFSGSGRTVPKLPFIPDGSLRQSKVPPQEQSVASGILPRPALAQTLSPQTFKISNDFTELSSRTNRPDESLVSNPQPSTFKASNNFGRLDLQNNSALRQNKFDLIVSEDKFITSSVQKDLDVSKIDHEFLKNVPPVRTTQAKPTQNPRTATREVIPENPYRRVNQTILGSLDRDSFANRSLEVSQNYGFIAPKRNPSLALDASPIGKVVQREVVQDRKKNKKVIQKQTEVILQPSRTLKDTWDDHSVNRSVSRQPRDRQTSRRLSSQEPVHLAGDTLGEIIRSIFTLILRFFEMIYGGCSEVIDKVLKDDSPQRNNNPTTVYLTLPLGSRFTMDRGSYESLKKALVILGGFILYRYLFK